LGLILSARPPIQVGAHAGADLRHIFNRGRADRECAQVEIAVSACIFAFGRDELYLDRDAADVSKSLALHLHHLVHRRHHTLVEMAHDPDRAANDERDDQNAEGQRQHVVSVIRRRGKM
jgi:hypothetical protein